MIQQFTVDFKDDPTKANGNKNHGSSNSTEKLSEIIEDLNQCPESYCIVIQVMSTQTFDYQKRVSRKLHYLLEQLTKREREVFDVAIRGVGIKDIAEKLSISIDTVKTHRKRIVSKANVNKIEEIRSWL